MTEQVKENEQIEVKEEIKETPPTQESVLSKLSKGEELSETENELFKALPKEVIPSGQIGTEEKTDSDPKTDIENKDTAEENQIAQRRRLIEEEVEKPREKQDLNKFTPAELSIFWDLKKARRKNQTLEDELEISRVENIVLGLKNKNKETEEIKTDPEPDPLDFLKDKEDDDILTVSEAKKLVQALQAKKEPVKQDAPKTLRTVEQVRLERVEAAQSFAKVGIKDFDDVIDYAQYALEGDKEAVQILRDVAIEGGNTVEQTYWLIKGSKVWPEIEKKIAASKPNPKKDADTVNNINRAKKLEENGSKIKTTGPASGATAVEGEFTMAELSSMTHKDIRKLSKATREKILQKFGSNPNYSV